MPSPAPRSLPVEPSSEDDVQLLQSLQRGEEAGFESMVRRHSPRMLSTIRRILRNEDDAREALQDAFASAFKAVAAFTGGAKLSTWLHRIAVNAALMKLRSRRRHPEASLDDLLPKFKEDGHELVPNGPWIETPGELASRSEVREFVRQAIDEMPETYRVVLVLRDLEELSTDEVAERLEITPNAVKIRLHRARQALRARLDRRYRLSARP